MKRIIQIVCGGSMMLGPMIYYIGWQPVVLVILFVVGTLIFLTGLKT